MNLKTGQIADKKECRYKAYCCEWVENAEQGKQ